MSTVKQARQKTIGINPLDHYLSMHQPLQQDISEEKQHEQSPVPVAPEGSNAQESRLENSAELSMHEKAQEQQVLVQETVHVSNLEHKSECNTGVSKRDSEYGQHMARYNQEPDFDLVAQILQNEDMQGPKQRITLHLSQELLEKVKNAVFWEPGLTLAGFAHYALEKAVEQLEHERGTRFPDRKTRKLRGGRPLK